MIPARFLSKMGEYDDFIVGGDTVKAKVVDSAEVLYADGILPKSKVIGLDFKKLDYSTKDKSPYHLLVLCWQSNPTCPDTKPEPYRCLIVHLGYMNNVVPKPLKELLTNTDFCFVTPTTLPSTYNWIHSVAAGDLAARVLKKPLITDMRVGNVANQVGVRHEGVSGERSSSDGAMGEIYIAHQEHMRVLTPSQVKTAVAEACTCYRVASKLLLS